MSIASSARRLTQSWRIDSSRVETRKRKNKRLAEEIHTSVGLDALRRQKSRTEGKSRYFEGENMNYITLFFSIAGIWVAWYEGLATIPERDRMIAQARYDARGAHHADR